MEIWGRKTIEHEVGKREKNMLFSIKKNYLTTRVIRLAFACVFFLQYFHLEYF